MRKIKTAAAALLLIVIAVSMTACGKQLSPLEKLAGYYEADLESFIKDAYPDLTGEDVEMMVAGFRSSGFLYSLTLDKEGKGNLVQEDYGSVIKSEEISFDPDKGIAFHNGNEYPYTFENRTIFVDGIHFVRASKKSERVWPYGAAVSTGGDEYVGTFWVPDDWTDNTDYTLSDLERTYTYTSPDENYYLNVYAYHKEEWEALDSESFESPEALVNDVLARIRSDYSGQIESDDMFETEVAGCYAVRDDMVFSDESIYTAVVFKDDADSYHILIFESLYRQEDAHIDEYVDYVTGHYKP